MKVGAREEFYRLYSTAAKGIKKAFPDLMVGGPAVGATGEVVEGKLQPHPFLQGLLKHCQSTGAPLDFFSWHTYTDDPWLYAKKAKAIRAWLDTEGFTKTEIHLNEWNYLPHNDWGPLLVDGQGEPREKWYEEMGSARGAAFLTMVLIDLQESPIAVANFYSGDTSPFGLFSRHGVPKKSFYGMKAFRQLLDTPERLQVVREEGSKLAICAGKNAAGDEMRILVSQFQGKQHFYQITIS